MNYTLACADVLPGCPTTFASTSIEDILAQVIPHARDAHGIETVTDEVAALVTAAIREVSV